MHEIKPDRPKGSAHDFLTYLCYKSDAQAGSFQLDGRKHLFSLWLDGRIVFEDDSGSAPSTVAYSGDGFSSQDLKQALRSGKRVSQARFRIEQQENLWTCTLKSGTWDVSGLKLAMPAVENAEERLSARMLSVEAFNALLDSLYEQFIEEVHGTSWKAKGYREFQKWLREPS